jgi:hypothetical protein
MIVMSRPTPDDLNAMRGLILAQLGAFAAGDAEQAYSLASPALRARFASAQAFLDVVWSCCPETRTATEVRFGKMWIAQDSRRRGEVVQLIDAEGPTCLALCYFSKDENGWRINGWISPTWQRDGFQVLAPS